MARSCGRDLKVAIIGGGPGGLGAAIELAKLPFVQWALYEKKSQISETGGGISLHAHAWRLLEYNGAAANIGTDDVFRPPEGHAEERRNGRTGELLVTTGHVDNNDKPPAWQSCRLVRAKLQAALHKVVDQKHIYVGKKLVDVQRLPSNQIQISFEDGYVDKVDLLVGADGIRSFARQFSFPSHSVKYTGQCVYRTIVSKDSVRKIKDFPWTAVFWKHTSGLYVYTCPLGNDDFEVTARIRRPEITHDPASWGRPFDLHALLPEFSDFCSPVQQVLQLAAEKETQEFALHCGPRLQSQVANGNIALIGDAAHPFLGNFGAGAGFTLEDVYALAKVLEWAWRGERSLSEALGLFDSLRSPHYARLYGVVDHKATVKAAVQLEGRSIDDEIEQRVMRVSQACESWMYGYEVMKAIDEATREANQHLGLSGTAAHHMDRPPDPP